MIVAADPAVLRLLTGLDMPMEAAFTTPEVVEDDAEDPRIRWPLARQATLHLSWAPARLLVDKLQIAVRSRDGFRVTYTSRTLGRHGWGAMLMIEGDMPDVLRHGLEGLLFSQIVGHTMFEGLPVRARHVWHAGSEKVPIVVVEGAEHLVEIDLAIPVHLIRGALGPDEARIAEILGGGA